MALTVLYFGGAREAAGTGREALPSSPPSVGDLRRLLIARHPALERILAQSRIAVGEELADDDSPIPEGAEVAVIPPVAGGRGLFRVTDEPLDLAEVVAAVSSPGLGGVVTFSGVVRSASSGRRVVRLEYEAYRSMAERTLARIGAEVGEEHGAAVAVVHRVGVLEPGALAVVIACAAAHRHPAFRACETVIDRLKKEVPVWKREVFDDGSTWVGLGP